MKQTCRTRFTLVEMLVVIAIIAILAGLLLPALNRAVDSAHSTACLNNQRQIGYAFNIYTEQNNDFLPPVVDWDGASLTNHWNRTRIWSIIYPNKAWAWDAGMATFLSSIFACPTCRDKAPCPPVSSHYAMNSQYLQNNGIDPLNPHKKSACSAPGRTLLFSEGWGFHIRASSPVNDYTNSMSKMAYHNEAANTLYFDLHAQTMHHLLFPLDGTNIFWRGK